MPEVTKSIHQALPTRLIQLGAAPEMFDNGNWFVALRGMLLRVVEEVDPGTTEAKREAIYEDHRMGALDFLNDYSENPARIRLQIATGQRGVLEAIYGAQADFQSKAEANIANVVGNPGVVMTGGVQLAAADVGHVVLAKLVDQTGTYDVSFLRQYYPDVDTGSGGVLIGIYNPTDGKFYDATEVAAVGGTLAWGTNRYMGQCDVTGMTLTDEIYTYDPSQQYTAELSDGSAMAEIPEWLEGANAISAGDEVGLFCVMFKYCQFDATGTTDDSYQVKLPFAANEREPLEMFRMLGDAPGGMSTRMVRRVYPLARLVAPPSEATRGAEGSPTRRSVEFEVFPDNKLGDGSYFFEQNFVFGTAA